jgi:hypothetical protein
MTQPNPQIVNGFTFLLISYIFSSCSPGEIEMDAKKLAGFRCQMKELEAKTMLMLKQNKTDTALAAAYQAAIDSSTAFHKTIENKYKKESEKVSFGEALAKETAACVQKGTSK